jgi:DNA topoisomerase-1
MSYTLVIAEKPSAAARIARALAEGGVKKLSRNGVPYFRIKRGGKDVIVAPAVGHLFVLAEKSSGGGWSYPTFSVEWRPTFFNKGSSWARKYYQNLKALSKEASDFISATDYDREGGVIAYNILRFICKAKDGERMKFSTLTKPDLVNAYEKRSGHLDFSQIEAGLTRHYLDWYWGINLSRALTIALRAAGGYKTLSAGRVQGPTLKILKDRQSEIEAFKPTPYWEIELDGAVSGRDITAFHTEGKFWEKVKAEGVVEKCKGRDGSVSKVDVKQYRQKPPFPFDLTTLQREAYSHFGFSPKQTLDVAQGLYLMALISYPRTSSQKLPAKIGYRNILKSLKKQKEYKELCERLLGKKVLRPSEGPKVDPAHPAIFPTGSEPKKLSSQQEKLYDLIVKRFLSVFAEPAVRETIKVVILVADEGFVSEGVRTIEKNWMEYYSPYARFKEQILPPVKEGDEVDVKEIKLLDKETQPPKMFTQASILKEMEKLSLGTKATRAGILQTLYDRGYIKERAITVTELGKSVVESLEKNCPEIVSVELTKQFERKMEDIQEGEVKRDDVVKGAEESLRKILREFKKKEKVIGTELLAGVREMMKEDSVIGRCKCGGELQIKSSRTGKRLVGCSNYPKCTETYSLPQKGRLTILKKKCECGLYIVRVKQFRKRYWDLCVRCGFVGRKSKKAADS